MGLGLGLHGWMDGWLAFWLEGREGHWDGCKNMGGKWERNLVDLGARIVMLYIMFQYE
jgi:hypothetical protein